MILTKMETSKINFSALEKWKKAKRILNKEKCYFILVSDKVEWCGKTSS